MFQRFKKKKQIGWVLHDKSSNLIWYPPEPIALSDDLNCDFLKTHYGRNFKNILNQYYLLRCPFDLNFKIIKRNQKFSFQIIDATHSNIDSKSLKNYLHLSSANQWRKPNKPLLQIKTAYRFLTDTPIYISQLPAFAFYAPHAIPGIFVSGRFPIDVWPRSLMWAIEIHDIEQPIQFKRGDPWFMVKFESFEPSVQFELFEADVTESLNDYTKQVDGVTAYVNQTFSLFKTAILRRPKVLLKRK